MRSGVDLVFCALVVLTCSSQTGGQSSVATPVFTLADLQSHAGSSASPHLIDAPGNENPQWTQHPAEDLRGSTTQTTAISDTQGTLHSETIAEYSTEAAPEHSDAPAVTTPRPPSPSDTLSSTLTFQSTTPPQHPSTLLTSEPLITLSSQPADGAHSTAYASTFQPQSESLITATTPQPTITGHPLTSHAGWGPAGPTHWEVPSELKVGDEDLERPRMSPNLDPLLAGLLSVFIVTTAIFFIFLFLKFRQRTNHPEFHRLQDLPMDDLMEDTPLSRYTY